MLLERVKMVIIVTAKITPDKKVKQLALSDSDMRLKQYIDALEKLLCSRIDAGIVVCDNSGVGIELFRDIEIIAEKKGIRFEALSFKGDSDAVVKCGKGYGEGEILEYVLSNSKLIQSEDYMMKVTGRLVVDNIANLAQKVKKDRIYFNIPNIHRRDMYDTRLYAMPIAIYEQYFGDKYRKVDDEKGYYLEYVYTDVVKDNHLKVYNFPSYPRIVGISGSGGIHYEYKEWKSKIRDGLSLFNIYGRLS